MRARTLALTSALPSSSSLLLLELLVAHLQPLRRAAASAAERRSPAKAASASRIRPIPATSMALAAPIAAGSGSASSADQLVRRGRRATTRRSHRAPARERSPSAASISCCFENTRPRPASGSSTLEARPERLDRPGPAADRERARDRERRRQQAERQDDPEQAIVSSSRAAAWTSRRRAAHARCRSCRARASAFCSRADASGARSASAAPPPAIAAKWPRSRERATCPSSRAFSSLRCDAGRVLSCAELAAMRGLFQSPLPDLSAIRTSIGGHFGALCGRRVERASVTDGGA